MTDFYNWLQDNIILARMAFDSIGVKAQVGFYGTGCGSPYTVNQETANLMEIYATDCYFENVTEVVQHLLTVYETFQVPIVLGEWGDIWAATDTDPVTKAVHVNTLFLELANPPWPPGTFKGFNYWRDKGDNHEGALSPLTNGTYVLNLAGLVIQHWFRSNETQVRTIPVLPPHQL